MVRNTSYCEAATEDSKLALPKFPTIIRQTISIGGPVIIKTIEVKRHRDLGGKAILSLLFRLPLLSEFSNTFLYPNFHCQNVLNTILMVPFMLIFKSL